MKTVKVHDETHRALKGLKDRRRARSMDQVIRELVRDSTGTPVEGISSKGDEKITEYIER